jgi:hypothetical protein
MSLALIVALYALLLSLLIRWIMRADRTCGELLDDIEQDLSYQDGAVFGPPPGREALPPAPGMECAGTTEDRPAYLECQMFCFGACRDCEPKKPEVAS